MMKSTCTRLPLLPVDHLVAIGTELDEIAHLLKVQSYLLQT